MYFYLQRQIQDYTMPWLVYTQFTYIQYCVTQVDHDSRKSWDAYAGDMAVIDSDSKTNCKLIHWIMKYPVSPEKPGNWDPCISKVLLHNGKAAHPFVL